VVSGDFYYTNLNPSNRELRVTPQQFSALREAALNRNLDRELSFRVETDRSDLYVSGGSIGQSVVTKYDCIVDVQADRNGDISPAVKQMLQEIIDNGFKKSMA